MSGTLTLPIAPEAADATAGAVEAVGPSETVPDYEELAARFRPVFRRIAEGAVQAEQNRELRYDAVAWLREVGFGAVRIPLRYGGFGATLPQFFRLLLELAEADSNVSHLLRGHFAFLEQRLNHQDSAQRDFWFPKVVAGDIIGYAMAERNEATEVTVNLTQEGEDLFLDGTKYYCTGTIYADWIVVSAREGEQRASVYVSATAPGVTRIDDWDGFGQRLTGSGSTRFERVRLSPEQVIRRFASPGENKGQASGALPVTPMAASSEPPVSAEAATPPETSSATDAAAAGSESKEASETREGGEGKEGDERQMQGYGLAFLQMILLTSIAGAGRAALRDGVEFVRNKTRTFGVRGLSQPREDPLVQRVIGRVASLSYAADSILDNVARALEEVHQAKRAGMATEEMFSAADIQAFQAQQIVIDLVLQLCSLVFEVGGASATSESRRFDRHWRNARTAASHNPAIIRERAIGEYHLNGTRPRRRRAAAAPDATTASAPAPSNGNAAPAPGPTQEST